MPIDAPGSIRIVFLDLSNQFFIGICYDHQSLGNIHLRIFIHCNCVILLQVQHRYHHNPAENDQPQCYDDTCYTQTSVWSAQYLVLVNDQG